MTQLTQLMSNSTWNPHKIKNKINRINVKLYLKFSENKKYLATLEGLNGSVYLVYALR